MSHLADESVSAIAGLAKDEAAVRSSLARLLTEVNSVALRHKTATTIHTCLARLRQASECLGAAASDADPGADIDWNTFARTLKARRLAAKLGQKELAVLARVSVSHLRAIENGDRRPSPPVLMRLLSIPSLGLRLEDLAARREGVTPTLWLAPQYDPRALLTELCDRLNGSGCSLEQTFAYLDSQSACDYLSISSEPTYLQTFANSEPLEKMAKHIVQNCKARTLDVIAIGSGGALRETRMVQALLRHAGARFREIRFLLLDISHTLLMEGYKYARACVGDQVKVIALHGNFHELSQYPIFGGQDRETRCRVFIFLGTMANLDNEVRFFRDNMAGAAAGDYFLSEYSTAFANAKDLAAVRRNDPALIAGVRESHRRWMIGPIQRYCRGVSSIEVTVELDSCCIVPGSYELVYVATVTVPSPPQLRRFVVQRVKRYDSALFQECLEQTGWRVEQQLPYGFGDQSRSNLMLLSRSAS